MIGKPKRGKWHKVFETDTYNEYKFACNAMQVTILTAFEDADEYEAVTGEDIPPGWVCRHRICAEEVLG